MQWFQYGAAGVLAAFTLALVRIAIRAERGRADDWRTAYTTVTAANERLAGSMERLITSVDTMTTSQREMLALLYAMAPGAARAAAAQERSVT